MSLEADWGLPEAEDESYRLALDNIQAALARLERMPLEQLAEVQSMSLERMLRHAHATTAFYRDRLAPIFASDEPDWSRWNDIPILTRHEARENAAAMLSSQQPAGTRARSGTTSGSSGTPLPFQWNTLNSVSTRAVVERMIEWHGLDPNATVAEIKSFPDGAADYPGRRMSRSWSYKGRAASYFRLTVKTPIDQQLQWLESVRPRYLLTYPTLARELARTAISQGRQLSLDAIVTVGEVLAEETRTDCAAAFGARIIDSYGCQEMGKVAIQCDHGHHYHVCVSNVLLEVLDDSGAHVAPGEVGRLVLTSLHNYAMPFIRYDIGDYGELGSGYCSCGRTLPVLGSVVGRRRNMLTLPGGNKLWLPGRVLAEIAEHVPLTRLRLVQKTERDLQLHYVPKTGTTPDIDSLQRCFRREIHPELRVTLHPATQLPRSAGGKYEDVVGLDG